MSDKKGHMEYNKHRLRLVAAIEKYMDIVQSSDGEEGKGGRARALLWQNVVIPLLKDARVLSEALNIIDSNMEDWEKSIADQTVWDMHACEEYIGLLVKALEEDLYPEVMERLLSSEPVRRFNNSFRRLLFLAWYQEKKTAWAEQFAVKEEESRVNVSRQK